MPITYVNVNREYMYKYICLLTYQPNTNDENTFFRFFFFTKLTAYNLSRKNKQPYLKTRSHFTRDFPMDYNSRLRGTDEAAIIP